ncbi:MAG: hypothetical protein ACRC35_11885 [Angustibacter sp.]
MARAVVRGHPVLAVPSRGDAEALGVTLHGLRVDHPDILRTATLMVVDDVPGGPQTAVVAELAHRHQAMLLRYDEVDGWASVEVLSETAPGSVAAVIEAGTLVRPGGLAQALDHVERGTAELVATPGAAPLDCWVARAQPPRPAVRGFGAVDAVLAACWRHAGWTVQRPPWLQTRRVTRRPPGRPGDIARNQLLGAMHTGGAVPDVVGELSRRLAPATVERALADAQREWRSPLARQDAVYWFPDPDTGAGWTAARDELDRDGAGRAARRFGFLDGSLVGPGRRALSWATMARRAVRRGWHQVVVVEGCFALRQTGLDRMRRDLEVGVYGAASVGEHRPRVDVVHLDRTHPGDNAGPLLAVLLSKRALAALADRLPATTSSLRDADPADVDPAAVLHGLARSGRLRVAGQSEPVVDRPDPTGRWRRR